MSHPVVDRAGNVCMDILGYGGFFWCTGMTVRMVLIAAHAMLSNPHTFKVKYKCTDKEDWIASAGDLDVWKVWPQPPVQLSAQ